MKSLITIKLSNGGFMETKQEWEDKYIQTFIADDEGWIEIEEYYLGKKVGKAFIRAKDIIAVSIYNEMPKMQKKKSNKR